MFLEVKKSPKPLVTLVGPRGVINEVYQSIKKSLKQNLNNPLVTCTLSTLGNSMELRLTGLKGVDNTTLMKSSLLEELQCRGYTFYNYKINIMENSLAFCKT